MEKVVRKKDTEKSKAGTKPVAKKKAVDTKPAAKKAVAAANGKKKVIFIGSEAAPFIATGGLADVLGSLPKALAARGNDVSVIIPLYGGIGAEWRKKFEYITNFYVSVGWRRQYCGVFRYVYQGVTFYFLDNEYYFKREGNIYGFYDDGERYAFFSRAAIDTIVHLDIYPDVVHCNDWQSAAAVIYLKGMYYGDKKFAKVKTVFTIHNIEYQGIFGLDTYEDLFGFSENCRDFVEFNSTVNLMKGAIEMTDIVSTVSPTYANEIKNAYFAHGLDGIINRNASKLRGILNGIDVDYYNPATDKFLFANYSVNDLSGKAKCKEELQKMLGLAVKPDVPIIAMITRLVSHKGLDLVRYVLEMLLSRDVQLVILGKGETAYENFFNHMAYCYKGKCVSCIAFNQDLSRKIYSGADIFLMPSKMEPCGLSQMIASRYGTVAVVRETGGLNDSIKAFNGKNDGNGFSFKNYNAHDMLYVVNEAVRYYNDKEQWAKVQKNAMNTDFSWGVSAEKYEEMYKA